MGNNFESLTIERRGNEITITVKFDSITEESVARDVACQIAGAMSASIRRTLIGCK